LITLVGRAGIAHQFVAAAVGLIGVAASRRDGFAGRVDSRTVHPARLDRFAQRERGAVVVAEIADRRETREQRLLRVERPAQRVVAGFIVKRSM